MSQSVSSINVLVGTSAANFVKGMDKAISTTRTKGVQWQRVMKTVSVAVGGALLGVAAASVRMSNEFEQSLTKMQTLVGIGKKDVEEFKIKIISLSKTTGIAANELANALYFITSSGLEGAEAFKALESSAQAAAIGMGETEVIADALTSVINAYGQEAYTANEATNILLKTVKLGKAEADQLAASIGSIVPNAAILGVSFEDLGSAIAATTLTGKNASEAITGLNSLMMALIKTEEKGEKRLKSVDSSYKQLRATLKSSGITGVIAELNKHFAGNVVAIGEILRRKEAINAFMTLTGKSASKWAAITEDMTDKTNELGASMDIYSETKGAKWNQMTADMASGMRGLGDAIGHFYLFLQAGPAGGGYLGQLAKRDAVAAAKELEELQKQATKTWAALGAKSQGMDLLGYGATGSYSPPEPDEPEEKKTATVETLTEKIQRLNNELLEQAIAGKISADTMTELKEATAELADANEALGAAVVASSNIMTSALQSLPYMESDGLELISDEELAKFDILVGKSKGLEAQLAAFQEKYGVMIDFSVGALDRLTTMHATSMANQMAALTTKQEAERAAIAQTLGDSEQARERLKELDAQHAKERGKQAERAAKQQKALGIAQAAIHTAVAVAEALPDIALSIAVGALGAAEVGVIASTQIPGYRFGTDHHFGGMAEINEGPSGGEIVNMPRGSSVTSTFDQMRGGKEIIGKFDPHEIILYLREQTAALDYRTGL